MDKVKIEGIVSDLLVALGENKDREGLVDTPKRVANAYEEMLGGYAMDDSIFYESTFAHLDESEVLQRDIEFHSLCEHHMLPFYGKIHIAYLPKDKVIGLSKLSRISEVYSKRLQLQEQLTSQIAHSIFENLDCYGVMVVIEAEHMCMNIRGVKKPGTVTKTICTLGEYKTNSAQRLQSLQLLGVMNG